MRPPRARLEAVAPALVFAAAVLCFLPALDNGFVQWDDPYYLTENLRFRGLGWEQVRWMFTNTLNAVYQPLAWLTLGLDYKLWGMEAGGYHLSSVFWHGALSSGVFLVLKRLLDASRPGGKWHAVGALLAALLYAVHPLRTEAVAWASERRELVGGFFWTMSVWLYLRAGPGKAPALRGPFACFLLALFAKGTMLTLPLVLLVLDWYPLRRLTDGRSLFLVVREKAWFFAAALAFGLLGAFAISEFGEPGLSIARYGLSSRLAQIAYSFAFYPAKTLWPAGLTYLYQMPATISLLEARYLSSLAFLALATFAAFHWRRRFPAGLAAWGWYAAALFPVVGIVKYGPHIVADRYANLSTIGFYALLAAGFAELATRAPKPGKLALGALALFASVALARTARIQTGYWRDSLSLWERAIESASDNSIAHNNLGVAAEKGGRPDLAIAHLRRAIQLDPDFLRAYENLAGVLSRQGRWEEVADLFRTELARDPNRAKARGQLAHALVRAGKLKDAEEEYHAALRLDAKDPESHYNYGALLTRLGRLKEAYAEYHEALRLDPDSGEAHNNLGLLLAARGKRQEAVEHFKAALASESTRPLAHLNWGNALSDQGKLAEAARHYREAIRLDASLLAARFNLANTLARQHKLAEARRQYQQLLERAPWYEPARRNLMQVERLAGIREDDR